jgi:hypothetical protein
LRDLTNSAHLRSRTFRPMDFDPPIGGVALLKMVKRRPISVLPPDRGICSASLAERSQAAKRVVELSADVVNVGFVLYKNQTNSAFYSVAGPESSLFLLNTFFAPTKQKRARTTSFRVAEDGMRGFLNPGKGVAHYEARVRGKTTRLRGDR